MSPTALFALTLGTGSLTLDWEFLEDTRGVIYVSVPSAKPSGLHKLTTR